MEKRAAPRKTQLKRTAGVELVPGKSGLGGQQWKWGGFHRKHKLRVIGSHTKNILV